MRAGLRGGTGERVGMEGAGTRKAGRFLEQDSRPSSPWTWLSQCAGDPLLGPPVLTAAHLLPTLRSLAELPAGVGSNAISQHGDE